MTASTLFLLGLFLFGCVCFVISIKQAWDARKPMTARRFKKLSPEIQRELIDRWR